jgi:hypothetical protein
MKKEINRKVDISFVLKRFSGVDVSYGRNQSNAGQNTYYRSEQIL